jgi:hypothetical protein
MAAFGAGPAELAILFIFLSGFGLPLGVPPQAEDPAMAHVAPSECVLYASWSAMAKPDAKSANSTEQLLAEPELQQFAQALEKVVVDSLQRATADERDPKAEKLAKLAPLWSKAMLTRTAAVFVDHLAVTPQQADIRGGLLLDAGDQASAFVDALVQVLNSEEQPVEEVNLGKNKFFRFQFKSGPVKEVTLGAAGKYLLVGVGEGAAQGMIERLQAKQTPQWLTDLHKRLPVERRSTVSYLNTPALLKGVQPLVGEKGGQVIESLGLKQVGEVISVTGLDQEGMVGRTFVRIDGEPRGLLKLLDSPAITPDSVDYVPRDATIAAALSLKAQTVYEVLEQVISENAPRGRDDLERFNQEFERNFGFRLKDDVLGSLGNVWTVSLSPVDGLFGVTVTAEVTDRKMLRAVLQRAVLMLTDNSAGRRRMRLETTKLGDLELQSLVIPEMPFRPSWCITESRVIFGLTPQAVKSSLDLSEEERGLFSQPELAPVWKGEGRVIGVAYQDTPKVFEGTYGYLTAFLPMVSEAMNRELARSGQAAPVFDVAKLPSARSIHRHLRPSLSVTRRTKDGVESETHQTLPVLNVGASAPLGVALLLPAVQAAREAAQRAQSANNLKQIMLALHNYHDTFRGLPPAYTFDSKKKPGLSWRVLILPFIEEAALYQQFHLDEPWDSEHNKKLIAKMPKVFKAPKSAAGEGKTVYLGVAGESGTFPPPALPVEKQRPIGLSFSAFTDGLSNTIAVVEANDDSAVIWTKPDDFTPQEKDPFKGLLGLYHGGFQAGLCDGSVRFISEKLAPEMLMRLFERNDGNPVEIEPRR